MPVQDDAREKELIGLFQLETREEEGRGGTDAFLTVRGRALRFEVKSTSDESRSVTTVRDFGPDHLRKWQGRHWLIGFYRPGGTKLEYSLYGSPQAMRGWIKDKAEYVRPDFLIAETLNEKVDAALVRALLGNKRVYTLEDAKRVHKLQYSAAEYREKMDVDGGYSPARMLDIVRDRARYVIERGSTLNNPHIPGSYFEGWEKITKNHARRLRELVAEAL